MEIRKPVSAAVETQKNSPVLFILSIVLLVGLIASAVYLSFAKSAIQEQQNQLDTEIASLNTQIVDLQSQNIEGQQYAQQWLADLQKTEIHWSEVIKSLQDILPVDPLTQKPRVEFLTYSGSAGGKLALNAQTIPGSADPFADVSTLINTFNNSAYFKDAYIPSISHGVNESGQDLLSFVFNLTYGEQLPTSGSVTNAQVPVAGSTQQTVTPSVSPAVKVPRTQQ